MTDRVSTLDAGYQVGDLSWYPQAIDVIDQLYLVSNNAETFLDLTLTYTATKIVVDDTSLFPEKGLIKIGEEIIYYDSKTGTVFQDLVRAFSGSRKSPWPKGIKVYGSVMAEIHNSIKDATLNIETNLGTEDDPAEVSLNGILKSLEARFLAPKPIFRATPVQGRPPLTVAFQNFSGGAIGRYLWDFGDGSQSVETAPVHTYLAEGVYTVKLNVITSLGAQGIATKTAYINVSETDGVAFFYASAITGTTATVFELVDQTEGNVSSRHWIFDDGTNSSEEDPSVHYISHTYDTAGEYNPSLIVEFDDQPTKRLVLDEPIIVT